MTTTLPIPTSLQDRYMSDALAYPIDRPSVSPEPSVLPERSVLPDLMDLDLTDLDSLNARLEQCTPAEIIQWAWHTFGMGMASSSSFQTQSVPLLHLLSLHAPGCPILFLDTGFHFAETLAFKDQLQNDLRLNIRTLYPKMGHEGFLDQYGQLHRQNPDLCCFVNKVEPLELALKDYDAWITGIRRDQTNNRSQVPIVERQRNGRYKICPLANWTRRDVWQYLHTFQLPEHPLLAQGYMSIGCAPCTRPVGQGGQERDGRWAGTGKTECGLHLSAEPSRVS